MVGRAALAGQERELARLRAALGGDARVVLVTGDAGVGKTRFVAVGTAQGRVIVRGDCLPVASELPLWPMAAAGLPAEGWGCARREPSPVREGDRSIFPYGQGRSAHPRAEDHFE
jgi:predicted ATPase